MDGAPRDHLAASRFEIDIEGNVAFLQYKRRGTDVLVLVHTEVPRDLQGRGLAATLVRFALEAAQREGRRVVVVCPYVRSYVQKHPEVKPLVKGSRDE